MEIQSSAWQRAYAQQHMPWLVGQQPATAWGSGGVPEGFMELKALEKVPQISGYSGLLGRIASTTRLDCNVGKMQASGTLLYVTLCQP